MKIQLLLIAVFILNMVLIWSTLFFQRFSWFRILGVLIWLGVMVIMPFFPQPRFYLDFLVWRYVGVLAIILGFALSLWAKVEFLKGGMLAVDLPPKLITTGPYKYVRHPQYLGLILMFVGWCWVWAAVYAFYFGMLILALHWLQAYLEEKVILEKTFGESFLTYRLQTGMFWLK